MGHQRLGTLPATRKWNEVVELLGATSVDVAAVSAAVMEAADHRLQQIATDAAVGYSFWLLTQVTWAAKSRDFVGRLRDLGLSVSPTSTAVDVITQVGDTIERHNRSVEWKGHFGDFAALSAQSALTATVAQHGSGLFSSTIEDTQRAFRTYATKARFGDLSRRFFAQFVSRIMGSFVDRDLANHVGPGQSLPSASDSREFASALNTHTWETAAIVQRYAGDWYSKYNWETRGNITQKSAQGLVAKSMTKLRGELKRRA